MAGALTLTEAERGVVEAIGERLVAQGVDHGIYTIEGRIAHGKVSSLQLAVTGHQDRADSRRLTTNR